MVIKWGAFVLLVLSAAGTAWGIADWIDVADCAAGRRRCDTEPGKQEHNGGNMLLVLGGSLALCLGVVLADRVRDWRPTLGLPAGALIGTAVALSISREAGIWILVGVLLAVCAAVPIGLHRWTAAGHGAGPSSPAG
ncbi:hypothetical protein [Streptomyces sp. URMC 125]|uniref:hypothetical protein n=1 Tax=Streptomyces sp. URMC 125 TaxID=3423419 RepID=UPI003F1E33F7